MVTLSQSVGRFVELGTHVVDWVRSVPGPLARAVVTPSEQHALVERAKGLVSEASLRFDAIERRFAFAAVDTVKAGTDGDKIRVPLRPAAAGSADGKGAPVESAVPVKPAGSADPDRKMATITLNAILGKILKLNQGEGPFNFVVFTQTGQMMFLNVVGDGKTDPMTLFAAQAMKKGPEFVSRISGSDFGGLIKDMPDDENVLGSIAMQIMEELGIHIIATDGQGNFVPFKLGNKPEGLDLLKWFQGKFLGNSVVSGGAKAANPAANEFKVESREYSYQEILAPFRKLFLKTDIMNRAWKAIGLRDMVNHRKQNVLELAAKGEITLPNGAIFNGPPGVGKSATMEAMATTWARCGGYVHQLSLGKMEEKFIGSFANNLINELEHASAEAKKRGKPALIIIDEATNLVTGVPMGQDGARYYQGALDVLKNYSTSHPELIVVLATNAPNQFLDEPLTRSLRLDLVTFGLPDDELRGKMFESFLKEYGVTEKLDLTQDELRKLAIALPESMGADIRKFAMEFFDRLISREYAKRGLTTEPEIAQFIEEGGVPITRADVRDSVTFASILAELKAFSDSLRANKVGKREVGFH